MSQAFLNLRAVTKNYGTHQALGGVTLEVFEGEIFGLLGPNGAGKTTLMSILACLLPHDAGEIEFMGGLFSSTSAHIRNAVGLATQDLALYGELTARENLVFFGRLYGLQGKVLQHRVADILDFCGLTERADHRVGTFSGGMKRRLNLGVAVIHQPKLLLLDEPTTGVDPQSRNHLFEQIRLLNSRGMTVIYTSHYMEEVQALCPRIAIMDLGKIIACDRIEHLLAIRGSEYRLTLEQNSPDLMSKFSSLAGVRHLSSENSQIILRGKPDGTFAADLLQLAIDQGVRISHFEVIPPTLEDVFLEITRKTLRD
ncbi:MAG: ABC transporter ATP-binding protein [Zavarzinella sp.]